MEAHEAEMADYLDKHPEATEKEAYENTVDSAHRRMQDRFSDMIDMARMQSKEPF